MSANSLRTVARIILGIGIVAAILAFAAGEVNVFQSALAAAVVFTPGLFMWAVLTGLAELVQSAVGERERMA